MLLMIDHNLLFHILQIQDFLQHQIIPKIPTVVFITNLPVFIPAFFKSPCKILFGIVTKFDKLLNELLTPVLIGDGKFFINTCNWLKNNLSKTLIKCKSSSI